MTAIPNTSVGTDPVNMITAAGSLYLFVGFVCMFVPCVIFFLAVMRKPYGSKKFVIITFLINAIATLAYGTMASGYGWVAVAGRQFFFARYIDWFFTTPLQLLDLCGLGLADSDTTNLMIGLDLLMIVSGTIGAFLAGDGLIKHYGMFVLGLACFIPIVYHLVSEIPSSEVLKSRPAARSIFLTVGWITAVSWTCYPVVWLLAEGLRVISPDTEVLCYVVLDTIAKSVFGLCIVAAHKGQAEALGATSEETLPLTDK